MDEVSTTPNPPNPPTARKPSRPSVVPKAVGLNCPGCGGPLTLRTFSNAVNVTCPGCGRILDATDPKLAILQEAQKREVETPLIPLGTRGKWKGVTYEVVGFQRRTTYSDGDQFSWFEYLLFNPYAGYRYLTEYEGHWNDVTVCRALPQQGKPTYGTRSKDRLIMNGRTFTQFQTANAETTYILGEFPWQVRMGDKVEDCDYISPPFMLSVESTGDEATYSLGEYTAGKDIWQAFGRPGNPPAPQGVFANQPNPYGDRPKDFWNLGGYFMAAVVLLFVVLTIMAQRKEVLHDDYTYRQTGQEASFVTPVFALGGHTSDVDININTSLDNDWAYFNLALINEQTGAAYDFGREVSYYYGSDSDGSWSEGERTNTATLGSIPPGNYYLRVEPEMDPSHSVNYTLSIERDVPIFSWFWVAAIALILPPAFLSARGWGFEYKRWQDSDYPIVTQSSTGGDDD